MPFSVAGATMVSRSPEENPVLETLTVPVVPELVNVMVPTELAFFCTSKTVLALGATRHAAVLPLAAKVQDLVDMKFKHLLFAPGVPVISPEIS